MARLTANCDGSCEPNPNGKSNIGWVLYDDGKQIKEHSQYLGSGLGMTNIVAEYSAVLNLVEFLSKWDLSDYESLTIYVDCECVVKQLNGEWTINKTHIQQLVDNINTYIEIIPIPMTIKWLPGDTNTVADSLSRPDKTKKQEVYHNFHATHLSKQDLHKRVFAYLHKYANPETLFVNCYITYICRDLLIDEDQLTDVLADMLREGVIKIYSMKKGMMKIKFLKPKLVTVVKQEN